MAFDALRGYVQLANGLTDVTKQRAQQVARQLVDQGGDVVDHAVSTAVSGGVARQVQSLAEDLMATSRTNRDLLVGLVRTEVERAVARLGLVGADELATMTRLVERLQTQLDAAIAFGGDLIPSSREAVRRSARSGSSAADMGADLESAAAAGAATSSAAAGSGAPAKKVPVTKVPVTKVPAKKVPAKKVPVRQPPAADAAASDAPVAGTTGGSSPAEDAGGQAAVEQVTPDQVTGQE